MDYTFAKLCSAAVISLPVSLFAAQANNWVSASGEPVRSASGECWRDASWSKATASPGCVAPAPVEVAESEVPIPKAVSAVASAPQVVEKAAPAITPPVKHAAAPKAIPVLEAPVKVSFSADTFFDFDKAVLKPAGMAALDNVARKAKDVVFDHIVVIGHTDSRGSARYNQRLSEKRAESVKDYLAHRGISKAQLKSEGRGSTQPIFSNGTKEGRAKNRRVEIQMAGTAHK